MATPRIPVRTPRLLIGSMLVVGTLVLGACSSDDDDAEPNDADGVGDTSMQAPGTGPDDEIDLSPVAYTIPLTVEEEVPAPTGADGASGEAALVFDPATRGLSGSITTSGLSGPPTMAHVHEQPAGEETGPPIVDFIEDGSGTGFVLPDDVILTEEQAESLETGLLYVNVHTELNAPGEIRGQIVLQEENDTGN